MQEMEKRKKGKRKWKTWQLKMGMKRGKNKTRIEEMAMG